jgi:hypothetical protein
LNKPPSAKNGAVQADVRLRKELEDEDVKLKRLLGNALIDNMVLKNLLGEH